MARTKTSWICRGCGSMHPQWMGKCPDCGAWDSLEKFVESKAATTGRGAAGLLVQGWQETGVGTSARSVTAGQARTLGTIEHTDVQRLKTGISEFDRVLGGGFVRGSVVLLGGDPGIGKSTLLLQAAQQLAHQGQTVLYVSSEESAYQTKLRAVRLQVQSDPRVAGTAQADRGESLYILAETNLAHIAEEARRLGPALLVIDSIQMIYDRRWMRRRDRCRRCGAAAPNWCTWRRPPG
jgi:DNA repair protein RadA/Sms